jgi:serine phosphatase RsbU (regulator of sigma subunit)
MQEVVDTGEKAHASELAKARIEAATEATVAGINYASTIQSSLLPSKDMFAEAFKDFSVLWEPRDVVGGDIFWMNTFAKGTVLCVADCTGHGTPGALLTMLVVSAFATIINDDNCNDPAEIIWQLDRRLVSVFRADRESNEGIREGCDLAVVFVANDGELTFATAHTHIFVCDGEGVRRMRGQNIYVGDGSLTGKDAIMSSNIVYNPNNAFYIASDGLYDQVGGLWNEPYGYRSFTQIILDNHKEPQSVISEKVWTAFELHRGKEPRVDDVELISFRVKAS